MIAFHTHCTACDWEGMVRIEEGWKGCPHKQVNGSACGAPFADAPSEEMAGKCFNRKMNDAEAGEAILLREWHRLPAQWVRDEAGRVRRHRALPASWQDALGQQKVIALTVILGCEPFPEPQGKPVSFDSAAAAATGLVVGEEPLRKERRAAVAAGGAEVGLPQAVPLPEPVRCEALFEEEEHGRDWWEGLIESAEAERDEIDRETDAGERA